MDLLIHFCEEGTEGRLLKITENKQYFVYKDSHSNMFCDSRQSTESIEHQNSKIIMICLT